MALHSEGKPPLPALALSSRPDSQSLHRSRRQANPANRHCLTTRLPTLPATVTALWMPTPEAAQQDSQQRRQDQIDRAAHQHPGSTGYTGNPDRDLTSYTERMNGLNRLFRSFNWKKGDDSKKRRVRKLIEDQRRLEMNARKSGRGFTPTSMKEALDNPEGDGRKRGRYPL